MDTNIITFNCRGKELSVTKSLITRAKRFESHLNFYEKTHSTDKKTVIFLDDNPKYFELLLDVLAHEATFEERILNHDELIYLDMCLIDPKLLSFLKEMREHHLKATTVIPEVPHFIELAYKKMEYRRKWNKMFREEIGKCYRAFIFPTLQTFKNQILEKTYFREFKFVEKFGFEHTCLYEPFEMIANIFSLLCSVYNVNLLKHSNCVEFEKLDLPNNHISISKEIEDQFTNIENNIVRYFLHLFDRGLALAGQPFCFEIETEKKDISKVLDVYEREVYFGPFVPDLREKILSIFKRYYCEICFL